MQTFQNLYFEPLIVNEQVIIWRTDFMVQTSFSKTEAVFFHSLCYSKNSSKEIRIFNLLSTFLLVQTYLYNDLYFYNIKKNSWVKSEIPNPPPPRCSHQVRLQSRLHSLLVIFVFILKHFFLCLTFQQWKCFFLLSPCLQFLVFCGLLINATEKVSFKIFFFSSLLWSHTRARHKWSHCISVAPLVADYSQALSQPIISDCSLKVLKYIFTKMVSVLRYF